VHPALRTLGKEATPGRALRRLAGLAADAPRLAFAEWRDRRWFNELLFKHYAGLTEDRLVVLADEVFEETIEPRIYAGTADLIAGCKAAGQRVVLVSGSLDHVLEPLRRKLGADGVIANRLEYRDGVATGRLLRPVVAGPV
jgi:phosphoserine phosphatase